MRQFDHPGHVVVICNKRHGVSFVRKSAYAPRLELLYDFPKCGLTDLETEAVIVHFRGLHRHPQDNLLQDSVGRPILVFGEVLRSAVHGV